MTFFKQITRRFLNKSRGSNIICRIVTDFTHCRGAAHFLVVPIETALVILEFVLLRIVNGAVCRQKVDHGVAEVDVCAVTDTPAGCPAPIVVNGPTFSNCRGKIR